MIGTSHPFLDPSGYRAHLMAQLAQSHAGVPNLGNDLLEHFLSTPANGPANAFTLGKQFDFQFIYEHSAAAAAAADPDYRHAYLPDDVDLSNPAKNALYASATIQSSLRKVGPEPIVPIVSEDDWAHVPPELQSIIKTGDPLAI